VFIRVNLRLKFRLDALRGDLGGGYGLDFDLKVRLFLRGCPARHGIDGSVQATTKHRKAFNSQTAEALAL
jgi:hypothetical protein